MLSPRKELGSIVRCLTLAVFLAVASTSEASTTFLFAQPNASAAPQLATSFGAKGLRVTGVSPGGTLFGFSVARERKGYYANVVDRSTFLTDGDRDGVILWELPRLPERALWFVVDMVTGAYASAVGDDYRAKRIELGPKHLKRGVTDIERLSYRGGLVHFVVVRPATGAWQALVTLRSPADVGTDDNVITVAPGVLKPLADTKVPPPPRLRKGDVVILLNSYRGEFSIGAVGE
jgi:hypothetical protein